jgi:thioredoxin 1
MPSQILVVNDNSFKPEVLSEKVPVLVGFWADWCVPCKSLGDTLSQVARECLVNLKVCQINVDENPGLVAEYRIKGVPTLVLFKGGEVLATKVGGLDSSKVLTFVRSNL